MKLKKKKCIGYFYLSNYYYYFVLCLFRYKSCPYVKMSFNTSWDVDKYKKTSHEIEKFWKWKRAFLVKNKNEYEETHLVTLADKFIRIKFLNWK